MNKNILGHRNITNKELPIWLTTLKEFGKSKEEMLLELDLIDDLLSLQKLTDINYGFKKAVNHRKTRYALLEGRLEKHLEDLEQLNNLAI